MERRIWVLLPALVYGITHLAYPTAGSVEWVGASSDGHAAEWTKRVTLERELAATDATHQPRLEGGVIHFGQDATIGADGATLERSVGPDVRLGLGSIGRGRELAPLDSPPIVSVAGPEVRLSRHLGVTEWWRSLPSGLEQGVTLETRPSGVGPLVLEMRLGDGLAPERVSDDEIAIRDAASGAVVARYAHLVVADAGNTRIPARLSVVGGCVRIEVEDRGAHYPLVVDPVLARVEAILGAINADSIAMTGDGTRAIVVASQTTRVFVRTGTTWALEGLIATGGGESVGITLDGTRAVVGDGFADTSAGGSAGNVRVYRRSGSTWTLEATLVAGDGSASDRLGQAVAISGDGLRVVAGAPFDEGVGGGLNDDTGSARVFVRSGASWTEERTLTCGTTLGERCGESVAISGDGSRALVGQPRDGNATAASLGSARIFRRSGTSWTTEATLRALGESDGDALATSAALSSDGSIALLGAAGDDTAFGADAGSARVFVRTGTSWVEEATLSAPSGAEPDDRMGTSVALSGDGTRALVGAPRDNVATRSDAGTARLFVRTGTTWTHEVVLASSEVLSNQQFGDAVALAADGLRATVGGNVFTHVFTLADRANGAACGEAAPCLSGFCVDGVCCDAACGGTVTSDCQACTMALTGVASGTCAPLITGTVCRAPSGPCDAPETCSAATGTACPADRLAGSGAICRPSMGACDAPETCSGVTDTCPGDVLLPSGTACGGGATGSCSSPGVCTGTTPTCPGATIRAAGMVCQPAMPGNPCDVDDVCDGISDACPALFAVESTTCGAAPSGACDLPDHCSGTSGDCVPVFLGGTECRPAGGACDVAEVCSGASAACPPDGRLSAGVVCRSVSGPCDVAEQCDGVAATCPSDAFLAASVVCGSAIGPCDVEDRCSGTSPGCMDRVAIGTTCRPANGSCDVAEVCSGTEITCPNDAFRSSSTVCSPDSGAPCDAPDHCAGTSADCIAEYDVGTACRPVAGACDVPEVCEGTSPSCPVDVLATAGVSCGGTTVGSCSSAGTCSGTSATCPGATPFAAGTVCLPAMSGNPCDVDDTCDGASDACQARFAPATTVCDPAAIDVCDTVDLCSGTSADCVPTFLSGTECRPSAGACDAPELCLGDSASCPTDTLVSAGLSCRASVDPSCDPEEHCDGVASSCPADVLTCGDAGLGGDGGTTDGGSAGDARVDIDAGGPPPPVAVGSCACGAQRARGHFGFELGALLALCVGLLATRRPRGAQRRAPADPTRRV